MPDTMTLVEKTVFMKSVELLAGVPTEALAQLAAKSSEVHSNRGETLFHEGQEDLGAFIVVQGLLELRKGGVVVRRLRPGMAHGELFLRDQQTHQYSAVALEDCHLLNLRRADVLDALLEYPEFGLAMVQDLALRLHKLTERIIEVESRLEAVTPKSGPTTPAEPEPDTPALRPADEVAPAPRRRSWWRRARAAARGKAVK
jgi:CRP-like cAMP-binding protein